MKQFWFVATAVVLLTTLLPDGAFAQHGGFRGGGGGFHGGGGFRGAAIGGGFRGKVGRGFRGTGFRGAGWGWRGGLDSPAVFGVGPTRGYPYYSSTIPCIVTKGSKFGFGCAGGF